MGVKIMDNGPDQSHKSSLGMKAHIAVILIFIITAVLFWFSYTRYFAWVIPILFFIIEKNSKFVKFYAVQAFFICIIRAVISVLLTLLGNAIALKDIRGLTADVQNRWISAAMLPGEIDTFVGIGIVVFFVFIVIRVSDYAQIRLPGVGYIADKLSKLSEEE